MKHLRFESEIFFKLRQSEEEAKTVKKRYSHDEVFSNLRSKLSSKIKSENV